MAGEADGEYGGWKIELIVFVGGTGGSVHAQSFNYSLKELEVVESKRNTIRKGLVPELLNTQDTVLCSYFAQRSGERVRVVAEKYSGGAELRTESCEQSQVSKVTQKKGGSKRTIEGE